jgi:hypothetical protein
VVLGMILDFFFFFSAISKSVAMPKHCYFKY